MSAPNPSRLTHDALRSRLSTTDHDHGTAALGRRFDGIHDFLATSTIVARVDDRTLEPAQTRLLRAESQRIVGFATPLLLDSK